eukprot:3156743-Prymnesium_polylepis.1
MSTSAGASHLFSSSCPTLAQKYEAPDASEYIINMMPDELYEAGQRVKFSSKVDGRYLDHKHLIRMCAAEVFKKQDAAPPRPVFISADALGGYPIDLLAVCVGSKLQLQGGSVAFASPSPASVTAAAAVAK